MLVFLFLARSLQCSLLYPDQCKIVFVGLFLFFQCVVVALWLWYHIYRHNEAIMKHHHTNMLFVKKKNGTGNNPVAHYTHANTLTSALLPPPK